MSQSIESPRAALDYLRQAMQSDPEIAWTWHCCAAVSALDEGVGHEVANKAAARFMSLAFAIDTTQFDQWKAFESEWNKDVSSEPVGLPSGETVDLRKYVDELRRVIASDESGEVQGI